MAIVQYELANTLREARERYFRANGFGESGGYDDAWVDFKLGPVPLPFPNTLLASVPCAITICTTC
jgi:hypothetical protein